MNDLKNLQSILSAKQNQLNSLLEITKAVNNNFSGAALLKIFEYVLRAQLRVQKMAFFLLGDDEWELVINVGNEENTLKIEVENDLFKFGILQNISKFPDEKLKDFDYLMPIVHKKHKLAYLLLGDLASDKSESIDEKLKFIETISNFITISLENKRLFKQQLKQEGLSKEMELAAQVQAMLIPSELPKNKHIQVAGHYQPHGTIGGDYYDVISIDDCHVALCMCDVSGKGLSAGMLMANFQANLRSLVYKDFPIDQLVDHINYKIFQTTKGDRYITMFLSIFDFNNRILSYVNAGHNPPILIMNGDIFKLEGGCTILGAFDMLPAFEKQAIFVEKNALLITYTDGVTELENEHEEMFGMDKLIDFALKNEHLEIEDFKNKLTKTLIDFKGEKDYNDDFSILIARFL